MQNPLISSHVGLLQVSRPNLEHRRGAPEGMLAQAKLSEIVVVVAVLLEPERVQQIATAVTVAFVPLSLIVPFKCHHCHVHHYRYSYHYHGLGHYQYHFHRRYHPTGTDKRVPTNGNGDHWSCASYSFFCLQLGPKAIQGHLLIPKPGALNPKPYIWNPRTQEAPKRSLSAKARSEDRSVANVEACAAPAKP